MFYAQLLTTPHTPLQTQLTEQDRVEGADGQQRYSETSTPFLCSPPPNVLSDILSKPTTVRYLKKSNWLLPDVVVETVRGCGQPTPRQPVLVWRRFFPALRPQPSPPSFYLPPAAQQPRRPRHQGARYALPHLHLLPCLLQLQAYLRSAV